MFPLCSPKIAFYLLNTCNRIKCLSQRTIKMTYYCNRTIPLCLFRNIVFILRTFYRPSVSLNHLKFLQMNSTVFHRLFFFYHVFVITSVLKFKLVQKLHIPIIVLGTAL